MILVAEFRFSDGDLGEHRFQCVKYLCDVYELSNKHELTSQELSQWRWSASMFIYYYVCCGFRVYPNFQSFITFCICQNTLPAAVLSRISGCTLMKARIRRRSVYMKYVQRAPRSVNLWFCIWSGSSNWSICWPTCDVVFARLKSNDICESGHVG